MQTPRAEASTRSGGEGANAARPRVNGSSGAAAAAGSGGGGGGGGSSEWTGSVWSAQEIADVAGGTVIRDCPPGRVCTDTRQLAPGDWFLALRGPRFDGADFLEEAARRGCGGAVVMGDGWGEKGEAGSGGNAPEGGGGRETGNGEEGGCAKEGLRGKDARKEGMARGEEGLRGENGAGESNVPPNLLPEGWQGGLVVVPDTLGTLQGLAREARRRFGGVVVGVTGSVGKTTARALTALALSPLGAVHQTQGNLNNHIGVPLTLLALPQASAACVVEMGMSARGEIALLSSIAAPSIRLLLNVGPAHIGDPSLGSLEAIAEAKGEMLADAREGDICVVNGDDARVMGLPMGRGVRRITFGLSATSDVQLLWAWAVDGGMAVEALQPGTHRRRRRSRTTGKGLIPPSHPLPPTRVSPQITFGRSPGCDVQLLWARAVDGGMAVEACIHNNLARTGGTAAEGRGGGRGVEWQSSKEESTDPSSSALSAGAGAVRLNSDGDIENTRDVHGKESNADDKTVCVRINSPGLHLADNALAAAAVAVAAGVPLPMAARHMALYEPIGMRMRVERIRRRGAAGEEGKRSEGKGEGHEGIGVTVLNDAYNASPISVASALHLLHQLSLESTAPSASSAASSPPVSGRHVAVLGDMLELGSQSESAHVDALSLCLSLSGISLVLAAGAAFKSALGKVVQRRVRGGAEEGMERGEDGSCSNEDDRDSGEWKIGRLHCFLEGGGERRLEVHAFDSAQDLAEAIALSACIAESLFEASKEAVDMGLIQLGDVIDLTCIYNRHPSDLSPTMSLAALSSNGVSFGRMASEAGRISTTVVSEAKSVNLLAPQRPSLSSKPLSAASPHQRLPQRPARPVAAVAAETASAEDDSADVPPPGCSRIKIELARPLGLVLEERAGGIFVAEVARGGNAEATGLVDAGDQLIATSAIVFDDSDSYGGVVVKKGMRIVRFNVRGEKFDTVMAAIGTHPSYLKVAIELQKCKPLSRDPTTS
ncbi:unnamed protein product [Closterium sp. NIES-65]|nr:unnamed protein product [Closterium sp. NIES-65]